MKREEELFRYHDPRSYEATVAAFFKQYPTEEHREAFMEELAMPDPGEPNMDGQRPELN